MLLFSVDLNNDDTELFGGQGCTKYFLAGNRDDLIMNWLQDYYSIFLDCVSMGSVRQSHYQGNHHKVSNMSSQKQASHSREKMKSS